MDQVPDRLQLLMFGVAGIILIMIFSALLSAAEKAVDAVNKNDIRSLAEEGNIKAQKTCTNFRKTLGFYGDIQGYRHFFRNAYRIVGFSHDGHFSCENIKEV